MYYVRLVYSADEGGTEVYFVDDAVGAEATGTYMCRAENQFGSSQETVHITVAGNYIHYIVCT